MINVGTAFMACMQNTVSEKLVSGLLAKGWRIFLGVPLTEMDIWTAWATKHPQQLTVMEMDVRHVESVNAAREKVCQATEAIDMLISHIDYKPSEADRTITDGLDYDEMRKAYDINAIGVLRVLHAFFGLLEKGSLKRISVVTDAEGSQYSCTQVNNYGYAVSKSALHMEISILFNRLRRDGYTFRLYATDAHEAQHGDYVVEYFTRNRSFDPDIPKHSDENRLVIRNGQGRELPF